MGKKSKTRNKTKSAPAKSNRMWIIAIGVGLVGVIILVLSFSIGRGSTNSGNEFTDANTPLAQNASLPGWLARTSNTVKEAYIYATAHPETLSYVPCYCGCGQHGGHLSSYNCFISSKPGEKVVYDDHGANCAMCVDIALITKKMLAQGKSLVEARQAVAQKYSSIGPATDTPPIPRS